MNCQYLCTRLNVENFQACKTFYRDVLGLRIKFEDTTNEYVEIDAGSTCITLYNRQKFDSSIFSKKALIYESQSAHVMISFKVRDLMKTMASLRDYNIEVVSQPTTYRDQGFIGACIRDPDGNLIELEQTVDVLIA